MSMNKNTVAVTVMLVLGASLWLAPGAAQAQENDLIIPGNPGDVSTGSPRENVRGGSLAERRPGNRVQAAISRHVSYQRNSLHDYGGGEPGGDEEVSPRVDRLVEFINAIFDALDQIFLQLLTGPIDNVDTTSTSTGGG